MSWVTACEMPWTLGLQKRDDPVLKENSLAAKRWSGFPESVFSRYSRRAVETNSINLAQGFPDFPGPKLLLEKISSSLQQSSNQYAPGRGLPELRQALERYSQEILGISLEGRETLVTCGATEGVFCSILGTVNPGERVLTFEPYYESYLHSTAAAGARLQGISLSPPDSPGEQPGCWSVNWQDFDEKTREPFSAIVVNTPHNPTGLLLNHEHWERVLAAARRHGAVVISDEVYENLVFDGAQHVSLLDVSSPRDRALKVSSISKSFGFTGFKVGWVQGRDELLEGPSLVHEATVFCLPAALQLGVARYLDDLKSVKAELGRQVVAYTQKRDKLLAGLVAGGFEVGDAPRGTYFVVANASNLAQPGETDSEFAHRLMSERGVAALPLSGFCLPPDQTFPMGHRLRQNPLHRGSWLRFAFCKKDVTLERAVENLSR